MRRPTGRADPSSQATDLDQVRDAPATGRWRAGDDRAFRVVGPDLAQDPGRVLPGAPTIFPSELQWGNYAEVFTQLPFLATRTRSSSQRKVGSRVSLPSCHGYAFARILTFRAETSCSRSTWRCSWYLIRSSAAA